MKGKLLRVVGNLDTQEMNEMMMIHTRGTVDLSSAARAGIRDESSYEQNPRFTRDELLVDLDQGLQ